MASEQKMNLPNKITILRFILALGIVFGMVICYSFGWAEPINDSVGFSICDLVCMIVFVIAAITDTIDGNIARKQNLITDFGKFLDPLADKALVDSSLILLAVYKPDYMPVIFPVLMIIRDLAVDGLRFLAASKGQVIAANKWGKAKTVAQMIVIPFVFIAGFPFNYWLKGDTKILTTALTSVALALSLISGGIYIYDGRSVIIDKELKEEKKEDK